MCQIEQYECTTSCEKFLFNYLNLLQVLIYDEKYVQLIGSSAPELGGQQVCDLRCIPEKNKNQDLLQFFTIIIIYLHL